MTQGKSPNKVLNDFLDRIPRASQSQMESARTRIWQRIVIQPISYTFALESAPKRHANRIVFAAVTAALLLLTAGIAYLEVLQHQAASRTALQVIEGDLQLSTDQKPTSVGTRIQGGEMVFSKHGSVIALDDGSHIEMRPNTEIRLEAAVDGTRIRLNRGSVIITAAKQHAGHLYVQTQDFNVSVVGTVFLVNAEEAGSRVAVFQGKVVVEQSGISKTLLPGEQMVSNPLMKSHPVPQEIAWSPQRVAHLALLEQSIPASKKRLKFEVSTIKEPPPSRLPGGNILPPAFVECRGIDGIWSYSDLGRMPLSRDKVTTPAPQGRCVGSAFLRIYLAIAYDIPSTNISGDEPGYYIIEAKAENPGTATKDELRQMLQNLLLDQLQPVAQRETRETDGFVLKTSKNGTKIRQAAGDEEDRKLGPCVPSMCVIQGKFTMERFATVLRGYTGGFPIVDRTGLPGIYEIDLTLNPVLKPVGDGGPRGGGSVLREYDPSLFRAMEEQLGLQLESGKVPVEFLTVNDVGKPREN